MVKRVKAIKRMKNVSARYSPVGRVIGVLETIARKPSTNEELAAGFHMSHRTVRRLMLRFEELGLPVYTRQTPSQKRTEWVLDRDKFFKRFTTG